MLLTKRGKNSKMGILAISSFRSDFNREPPRIKWNNLKGWMLKMTGVMRPEVKACVDCAVCGITQAAVYFFCARLP